MSGHERDQRAHLMKGCARAQGSAAPWLLMVTLFTVGCEGDTAIEPETTREAIAASSPGLSERVVNPPGSGGDGYPTPSFPNAAAVPSSYMGARVSYVTSKLTVSGTTFNAEGGYMAWGNRHLLTHDLQVHNDETGYAANRSWEHPIFYLYFPRTVNPVARNSWRAPDSCGHVGNLTTRVVSKIAAIIEFKWGILSQDAGQKDADAQQPDCLPEEEEDEEEEEDKKPTLCNVGKGEEPVTHADQGRCRGRVPGRNMGKRGDEICIVEFWYWKDTGEIISYHILYCY